MLYEIMTEDTGRENITRALDASFPGYTLIPTIGRWEGVTEPSIMAQIETDNGQAVRQCAEQIREANKQQAVLVEAIPSSSELVTDPNMGTGSMVTGKHGNGLIR
jgi:hypothetical protein